LLTGLTTGETGTFLLTSFFGLEFPQADKQVQRVMIKACLMVTVFYLSRGLYLLKLIVRNNNNLPID